MNSFLRQSTASQSRAIGPFIDDTDFKTTKTALTIANTDIKLVTNGGASANKNSGGGTHRVNGVYGVTFDATDTATVGEIEVSIVVAGALPVFHTFMVIEEVVYDALFAASAPGYLQPTTAGRTLDVSATGEAGIDWANVGSPTTAVNLSGTTIATTQKVDVDTIKTNPVVNGGTVTFPTGATLASTTNITAGTITTATNVTTVNGLAASVITATSIAADAITAAKVASDVGVEIGGAVWDITLASHLTSGTTGAALNAAGSAGDPWSTTLPGAYGAGTAGHIIGTAIPDVAAGAAGGLLMLGANDAGSGMSISATSSGSGLIISGNGLKAGLRLIGGTGGAGASFESGGGNNPGAVFTRTGSGDDISLTNSVATTLRDAIWTGGTRVVSAATNITSDGGTITSTSGIVSSQLADAVTHGGSSAKIQLGTSTSTPALKIRGSAIAGETVRIESTGIGGVGANIVTTNTSGNALKLTSTGDAFTVASSAGKGLVLNTLGNGIDITTTAIGNGIRIIPGISGVAIATGSAGTGHGLQIAGSVDGINVAGGSDDIKLVNSDAPTLRDAITKTAFTESYAADGAAPTLEQILFLIQQMLCEKGIVGTTLTVKKLDGSTTAATFTLDSATTPTAITRST